MVDGKQENLPLMRNLWENMGVGGFSKKVGIPGFVRKIDYFSMFNRGCNVLSGTFQNGIKYSNSSNMLLFVRTKCAVYIVYICKGKEGVLAA